MRFAGRMDGRGRAREALGRILVYRCLLILTVAACLSSAAAATPWPACNAPFIRGDSSGDSRVDIADVITTLLYLFVPGNSLPCMDAADVVLYVHSTVAIESLARGIPAVYLNVPNVLNPDPMVTFTDFKWRVDDPADLPGAINEIGGLTADEYTRRQQCGVAFTRDYFQPTSAEALEAFVTA